MVFLRANNVGFIEQNVDFIANDCGASRIMQAFLLYFRKEGMFSLRERDLVRFLCLLGSASVDNFLERLHVQ